MVKICEICGREIVYPNFIVSRFKGMHEEFFECGSCLLDLEIDRYMEFKEAVNSKIWNYLQLKAINKLTWNLKRGKL